MGSTCSSNQNETKRPHRNAADRAERAAILDSALFTPIATVSAPRPARNPLVPAAVREPPTNPRTAALNSTPLDTNQPFAILSDSIHASSIPAAVNAPSRTEFPGVGRRGSRTSATSAALATVSLTSRDPVVLRRRASLAPRRPSGIQHRDETSVEPMYASPLAVDDWLSQLDPFASPTTADGVEHTNGPAMDSPRVVHEGV